MYGSDRQQRTDRHAIWPVLRSESTSKLNPLSIACVASWQMRSQAPPQAGITLRARERDVDVFVFQLR